MAIFKLLLVLAVIVFGIRKKIFVGYLLLLAGLALPLLFGHTITDVLYGLRGTIESAGFWRLFGAIVIVTLLGQLLKKIGSLDKLTLAAQDLAGGKKTAAAILPAAVGLMPMPGGALLSAPLVAQVLKNDNHSPQFLAATNYWHRHVMEFFWPLYPGIILGAGITGIRIQTFSQMGLIMSLAMALLGYLFYLRHIKDNNHASHSLKAVGQIAAAIWPLFLAVFLALVTGLDIVLALVIAVIVTVISHRGSWRLLWPVIKEHINLRLFMMVFGIIVFKDLLELSGAVGDIPGEVNRLGIPPEAVIFVVAFLSGLLTGMVAAFVGLSFPILAGFLYAPDISLSNIFLTYLSGYLGMILSPTHFCLLLTTEYFKTELIHVYRVFVIPALLLGLFGFILYFLGYPWHIFN